MKAYNPRADSLPARVLAYFASNPDEELTRADISRKFDCNVSSVQASLKTAVEAGALIWTQSDDLEWVYRAGPNAVANPFRALAPAALAGAPAAPVATVIATLPVDDNVPVNKPKPSQAEHWAPLFDKLAKPGQSIAVPTEWRRALSREATRRNRLVKDQAAPAPTFKVGPDHDRPAARIWRLT